MNFQMFKLDLEKAEEPEIKWPTSIGSLKKQENSRKTSTSALLTWIMWITTNQKILQEIGIPDHLPVSWEICIQVKKQQLEPDMEQKTGSKSETKYVKAVYCHPAYLTYMQNTSCKMLNEAQAGIKIARRNTKNLRYAEDTTFMAKSKEELKNILMKMKEESEKAVLKLNTK